jgi:hypothetical protein
VYRRDGHAHGILAKGFGRQVSNQTGFCLEESIAPKAFHGKVVCCDDCGTSESKRRARPDQYRYHLALEVVKRGVTFLPKYTMQSHNENDCIIGINTVMYIRYLFREHN